MDWTLLGWQPDGAVYADYGVSLVFPREAESLVDLVAPLDPGCFLEARSDLDGDGRNAMYVGLCVGITPFLATPNNIY